MYLEKRKIKNKIKEVHPHCVTNVNKFSTIGGSLLSYKAFPYLTLMIITRSESHVHRLMKTFSIFLKKKAYVNTLFLVNMLDSVLQYLDLLDQQIFLRFFLQSQVAHTTLRRRCLEQRL